MIEPIMYFGVGFLVAALIGLVIVPIIHNRAVRLTVRRLEAATPVSMAEIHADKDQLRAEFAMSMRRLEIGMEQLRAKHANQLAELGKKSDAVNRLKLELGEKTTTIVALEAREKSLRDQLSAIGDEFALKTDDLLKIQQTLSEKEIQLTKMTADLEEQFSLGESQNIDIIALKAQVEALKDRLDATETELKAVEDRRDAELVELKAATHALSDERNKVEILSQRLSEREHALTAQTTETEVAGRRAADLDKRVNEQMRLLTESEFDRKLLRVDLQAAQTAESALRVENAEIEHQFTLTNQKLSAENTRIKSELDHMRDERDRLALEFDSLKREAEENWAAERVENAMLRDRIGDVAVEVARIASTLEGPNSAIGAIIAADPRGNANLTETNDSNGGLADRIRALQSFASEGHGSIPKTRN